MVKADAPDAVVAQEPQGTDPVCCIYEANVFIEHFLVKFKGYIHRFLTIFESLQYL